MPYVTTRKNLKLQLSPGLVACYNIQPGNGVCLFWDTKHTHTYLLTYLLSSDPQGSTNRHQQNMESQSQQTWSTYLTGNKCCWQQKVQQECIPVLIDIRWATKRPPMTASPVHSACPSVPPRITPITSCSTHNMMSHTCTPYIPQQFVKSSH